MKFIEITIEEFKAKQANKDLFLVDVREEYEFEDHNKGGINIPMGEILSRTEELKGHDEIYLCCASGKRSKTTAYHLCDRLDKVTIYSIQGGIKELIAN